LYIDRHSKLSDLDKVSFSAVININDMLRAKTIKTGAKIILIRLLISRALTFSNIFKSNTRSMISIGINAMVIRIIHILAIMIIANANIGNMSIIQKNALSINFNTSPNVNQSHQESVCIILLKFSVLEYMVTSGHTNHFDLSMSVDIVVQGIDSNRFSHPFAQKSS